MQKHILKPQKALKMLQRLISKVHSAHSTKAFTLKTVRALVQPTLLSVSVLAAPLLLLAAFCFTVYSNPTTLHAYTSPGTPTGYVNDFAAIIEPATKSSLEATLTALEKNTGTELVVVTVSTVGSATTVGQYATELFADWGIGKKGKNNGVLLLVAKDDREVRIEVGYGAEPIITDAFSGRVVREILLPAFRAGDYSGGIVAGVTAITNALSDPAAAEVWAQSGAIEGNQGFAGIPWQGWIMVTVFALIFLIRGFASFAQSKSWWQGGVIGFLLGLLFSKMLIAALVVGLIGLVVDFIASTFFFGKFKDMVRHHGGHGPWFFGGGSGGSHGGGFGGFGGGMSGGGGAGGRW